MYSSNVFIQCSHLDRNEHILLIQTNWVGGLNEMSELLFFFFELLFLKRNAVLLFSRVGAMKLTRCYLGDIFTDSFLSYKSL